MPWSGPRSSPAPISISAARAGRQSLFAAHVDERAHLYPNTEERLDDLDRRYFAAAQQEGQLGRAEEAQFVVAHALAPGKPYAER